MSEKKLIYENNNHISYTVSYGSKKVGILYLHGLLSSRKSDKGQLLASFAQKNGFSFLSLDYTAHGDSSGEPKDFRVGQCLNDICAVLEQENYQEPFVIVGSSLGGWLSFLLAEKYSSQTLGVLTLAAGVDFMPRIWNQIFDENVRNLLKSGKIIGPSQETMGYCFSYPMFEEAQKHLLLNRTISYDGPVWLIHGDKDDIIPFQTSLEAKNALESSHVEVHLIKGEKHQLKGYDLEKALDSFLKQIGNHYDK